MGCSDTSFFLMLITLKLYFCLLLTSRYFPTNLRLMYSSFGLFLKLLFREIHRHFALCGVEIPHVLKDAHVTSKAVILIFVVLSITYVRSHFVYV